MARAITKPTRYYGGKGPVLDALLDLLPRQHEAYCEPFCGGASLLFGKPPSPVEVINDADQSIVNFFRVLRSPEHAARLMEMLRLTPYARAEWDECHAGYRQRDTSDAVELARRWYVAVAQSYSGHLASAGWSHTKIAGHNPAVTWRHAIDALPRFTDRLRDVLIDEGDFADVIARYDGPETVLYCDPPYPMETRASRDTRYAVEMRAADHRRLLRLLTRDVAGMVLLSTYDGCELYEQTLRPAGWQCERVADVAVASSRKGLRRTEVVWLSPSLVARRDSERRQASLWADERVMEGASA